MAGCNCTGACHRTGRCGGGGWTYRPELSVPDPYTLMLIEEAVAKALSKTNELHRPHDAEAASDPVAAA